MNNSTKIKEQILKHIVKIIDGRIESAKQAIESARESRDNETKCTSGDKYTQTTQLFGFYACSFHPQLH